MLSYQHSYHAGNLADVHKHALLAGMLDYLAQKDKPFSYIETHAGRGLYRTDTAEAVKTGEAAAGIGRVRNWFDGTDAYGRVLAGIEARYGADAYPGSPLVAATLLRPGDRMHLAELHPREFRALREAVAPYGADCRQEDGLQFALARTPPEPRRGLMLIDPSYEVKSEYAALPQLLRKVHAKWNVGVLALWYPLLATGAHLLMTAALRDEAFPKVLHHEVRFPPAREGHGMTGSGMFVINAPFGTDTVSTRLTSLFETLTHNRPAP